MATSPVPLTVAVERIANSMFTATNGRGGQIADARAVLPDVVKKSHDRLCTVSRTIEIGTPITTRIE